jgi:hypothetical protein
MVRKTELRRLAAIIAGDVVTYTRSSRAGHAKCCGCCEVTERDVWNRGLIATFTVAERKAQ